MQIRLPSPWQWQQVTSEVLRCEAMRTHLSNPLADVRHSGAQEWIHEIELTQPDHHLED